MEPTVSVIIPAFNAAACLPSCLDSMLAQTRPASEVIVVDDGSSDGTAAVARAHACAASVIAQPHRGQGAARNAGLALARGAYVAFLDADDGWDPEFLAACVRFMESHPEALAVSTAGRVHAGPGRSWTVPAGAESEAGGEGRILDDFFRVWAARDHVRTGMVLMRGAALRAAGGQREDLRISQDLEYWGYLATFGPWGYIPRILWHGNSRTSALSRGWSKRYAERRLLCPTVEDWESRLAPRISPAQMPDYRRVRGRVAAGFAHVRILTGRDAEAREILLRYGPDMPRNRVLAVMRAGARAGTLGWRLACALLRAVEARKARRVP